MQPTHTRNQNCLSKPWCHPSIHYPHQASCVYGYMQLYAKICAALLGNATVRCFTWFYCIMLLTSIYCSYTTCILLVYLLLLCASNCIPCTETTYCCEIGCLIVGFSRMSSAASQPAPSAVNCGSQRMDTAGAPAPLGTQCRFVGTITAENDEKWTKIQKIQKLILFNKNSFKKWKLCFYTPLWTRPSKDQGMDMHDKTTSFTAQGPFQ